MGKKFALPEEGLKALEPEALEALSNLALEEFNELKGIAPEDLSDEQLDRLEVLAAGRTAIKAENEERVVAQAERIARAEAARAALEEPEEPKGDEGDEGQGEGDTDVDADVDAEVAKEVEAVVASGRKRPFVKQAVAKAPSQKQVVIDEDAKAEMPHSVSLIASAEIPTVAAGSEIPNLKELAKAFNLRTRGFRSAAGARGATQTAHIATVRTTNADELTVTERDSSETIMDKFRYAADESRLPGNSLVAAGGWCAPSVTIFDNFLKLEQADGLLQLPTVTWDRGGINFTKGPNFADVVADVNADFVQTEAQAEAGEIKPFTTYDCVDFEEIRPFATGYGVRGNILMDFGYPELKERYLEMVLLGHELKTNIRTINKIVPLLGAPVTAGSFGAVSTDVLDAVELGVIRLREKYSMGLEQTIDGFAPFDLLPLIRADLARRNGVDTLSVSNQQIKQHFAVRGANLQWIRGWQAQPTTGPLAFRTTVDIALYPAGTFVAGDKPIIDLQAIHDYDSLKQNMYTAYFTESARLVAQMGADGLLLRVADLQRYGRTGAADIGDNGTAAAEPAAA